MHEHGNVVVETALDANDDKGVAEDAAEIIRNVVVTDEFCPNEEYSVEDLDDENSVTFRFVITDSVLRQSLDAFKSKVTIDFEKNQIRKSNRPIKITGYEQLANESKFYLKVKNEPDVVAAVRNLKSDHIFMRKMPKPKKKS